MSGCSYFARGSNGARYWLIRVGCRRELYQFAESCRMFQRSTARVVLLAVLARLSQRGK